MKDYQSATDFFILAHRGGGGGAPENSLDAFHSATRRGIRYLETDVRLAEDNRLYLVHDPDSRRLNHKLRMSSVLSRSTLDELFTALPHCYFSIDPKHDLAVEQLAQLVARHKMAERVCIGSSSNARTLRTIARIHELTGLYPAMYIGGLRHNLLLKIAPRLFRGQQLAIPPQFIYIHHKLITRKGIASAHRAGLRIIVWTVNDEAAMSKLYKWGVDGFMTDYPARAQDILRKI